MSDLVSLNLALTPSDAAFVSALAPAAFYGKGVFTTLMIHRGRPWMWEKHWQRLENHAARIGIGLENYAEADVFEALFALIEKNEVSNGRARLTFFDQSANPLWPLAAPRETSLLMTTGGPRRRKNPLRLTFSPFAVNSRSPLAGVKSCNYMEHLLALEEARERGFDEAVRTNERGEICSAVLANVFWIKDETVFTPALATGCLAGTVREYLLENFPVREVKANREEIESADEIFLTSSGLGCARAAFGGKSTPTATGARLRRVFDWMD